MAVALLPLLVGCFIESGLAPAPVEVVAPSLPTVGSEPTAAEPPVEASQLTPLQLLARASLDLRGVRPSLDELAQVEADPASVEGIIVGFLDDPRFEERLVRLYQNVYLTENDYFYVGAYDYGLADEAAFARAVGQEPLRVAARVVAGDLPYTELVTGDWTMANEILGIAWENDYPEGEVGWRVVHHTDGRPAAGVLATNGMWWRYLTDGANLNRGRANAISRVLLCNDYLSKPIDFDRSVNLLDTAAVNDALANNPGCASCHSTLDPLASFLYGFYYYDYTSELDTTTYHAEREAMWSTTSGVAPGYYGTPADTLDDLGRLIAQDARFPECGVQTAWELLLQRPTHLDDTTRLTQLREVLLDADLRMKQVFASILTSPEYRAHDTDDPLATPIKLVTPDVLATAVEDVTGFRFAYSGYDMMTTDTYGLRTLAGGVDGLYVTRPSTEPIPTFQLVAERLAQGAAWYATERDATWPESARLFTRVDFRETPDTDRAPMAAQVQDLHWRLFGHRVEADGPEVEANLALWDELYAIDRDPVDAWAGLLSVLLRDPDFLFY